MSLFKIVVPAAQEQLRRRAVQAVRDGMSQLEAARIFGVTRQTVGVWIKRARNRSLDVLAAKRQGRPPGKTIRPGQAKVIAKAISNKPPDQLKLPQKPIRRAFEADPEAVRRWLEEDYPLIRAQAKRDKAGIYWG
jgi:transposase